MRRLPLLLGLLVGVVLFGAAMIMPGNRLEAFVAPLGLSGVIPGAEPPLGLNARLALGGAGFIIAVLIGLLASRLAGRQEEEEEPVPLPEHRRAAIDQRFAARGPEIKTSVPEPRSLLPAASAQKPSIIRPADARESMPPREAAMVPAGPMRPAEPAATPAPPERAAPSIAAAPAAVTPAAAAPPAAPPPASDRSPIGSDSAAALGRRLDELDDRVAAQLAQMAQQLAEIAATTRQIARTPAAPPPALPPGRLNRLAVGDGQSRERLSRAARELRSSLPPLDA